MIFLNQTKNRILNQFTEDPATKEFPIVFISARKTGMRNLFDQIFRTIQNIHERATNKLNKILRQAIEDKSVPFKENLNQNSDTSTRVVKTLTPLIFMATH